MDLIKNTFKKDRFLFPNLPPGDRIYKVIHDYILPDLEKIGFKMSKNSLTIKRKIDVFEQEIYFQKNRHNYNNSIVAFIPHFNVLSKWYVKWCIEKYGVAPINEYIKGSGAYNIPNWDKKLFDGGWYDLAIHDNLEIVKAIKDNIDKNGLPYLNTFSDKQKAIDFILNSNSFYYTAPMLFDFAVMLGDRPQAEKILKWFTHFKSNTDNKWQDFTLRDIANRQEALNNWAQQRI